MGLIVDLLLGWPFVRGDGEIGSDNGFVVGVGHGGGGGVWDVGCM